MALAIAGVVALAAGCARAPAPSPHAAARTAAPKATATSFPIGITARRVGARYVFLTKQKASHKVYVLRADAQSGRYFGQNTGRSTFTNPHVIFYGRDGKRLVADAPTGTVVEKDKTVRMSGGVRARSSDGLTLRSDALTYDDQHDLVHGQGNVTVTSPQGEELQGETLDWNLRDGKIAVAGAH
ncbi:MAG: hypothetical protein NVS2B8_03360 [Vulcanimicrobiaceae bacterium]